MYIALTSRHVAATAIGLVMGTSAATAQSTWTAAEGTATVTMAAPVETDIVTAGTMTCAAGAWTMHLTLAEASRLDDASGTATLSFFLGRWDAQWKSTPTGVELAIPRAAIDPLMRSSRFSIISEERGVEIRFPLAGSRRALTEAEALCPPRIMPVENSVHLTPFSSYAALAGRLRKDDIEEFRISTTMTPRLRAGMVEIGPDRRLLFGELCGSSWYFGVSGCNLAGFAPVEGADPSTPEGWRPVYESEGVFLYTDPDQATQGWPDLLAIPLRDGSDETRWRWNGTEYEIGEVAFVYPDLRR